NFPRRIPAGDPLRVRRECGNFCVPTFWRFTALNREGFGRQLRMLLLVAGKEPHPIRPQLCTSLSDLGLEVIHDLRRDQKFCVLGPAVTLFCQANLFFAEWFAMRSTGVLLVRCAVPYMTIDDN